MASIYNQVMGATLRERRQQQNRTLREVAGPVYISFNYLSEVERGRKEVSGKALEAICNSLDMELWWLLKEVSNKLKENA
jgi:transcriptional regulator with XRE-family HTH domain